VQCSADQIRAEQSSAVQSSVLYHRGGETPGGLRPVSCRTVATPESAGWLAGWLVGG
jgi:hypothetical protein